MAKGKDANLRRRENKSKKSEAEAWMHEPVPDFPVDDGALPGLPPKPSTAVSQKKTYVVETVSSDEEDEAEEKFRSPKMKLSSAKHKRIPQHHATSTGSSSGIKRGPLILLIILTGTTLIPALLFAGDYFSKYMPGMFSSIGYRLSIGSIPKKRVMSFYEKHSPEKLDDVPSILSKHYGNYPTLIRKLERKYQDYGYFIGWEEDETPMKHATLMLKDTYDAWLRQWNRHAPQLLKTAFRNVRYNLEFLRKKGRKIWRKKLWPLLEPIFGVPKGAEKQKRADAAEARKRRASGGSSGTRKKNRDYRDEE